MRRTMLLLVTAGLVLLLVGGVAVSKQLQETTYSNSPTTATESGGEVSTQNVSIQSGTQKAAFTSGSGRTFLRVAVSNAGNLLSFESPQGRQAVTREGYALCSGGFSTIHGYDLGSSQAGFGTPRISQPNPGKFPLTVTRNTTDGKLQLKQAWSKPDAIEKDVTVTMTVKNLTRSTISEVVISRFGDFDAGGNDPFEGFDDRGSRTEDTVFLWDDYGDGGQVQAGLMLTALTFQTAHIPYIEDLDGWSPNQCNASSPLFGPTDRQDLAMRMIYFVGNIGAGASKTVKFQYGFM